MPSVCIGIIQLPDLVHMASFASIMQVTIHEAETQLSKLITAAERGDEVIIARRDKPEVKIVAEKPKKPRRTLGFLASHEVMLDGFFDPVLDAQIADDFLKFSVADLLPRIV